MDMSQERISECTGEWTADVPVLGVKKILEETNVFLQKHTSAHTGEQTVDHHEQQVVRDR